jgi:hypothetical protein
MHLVLHLETITYLTLTTIVVLLIMTMADQPIITLTIWKERKISIKPQMQYQAILIEQQDRKIQQDSNKLTIVILSSSRFPNRTTIRNNSNNSNNGMMPLCMVTLMKLRLRIININNSNMATIAGKNKLRLIGMVSKPLFRAHFKMLCHNKMVLIRGNWLRKMSCLY